MNYKQILLAIIFIFFLLAGIEFNLGLIQSQHINIRGVEPNVIYTIQQLMLGEPLYNNVEKDPYSVTQYSPLYYIISSKISQILTLSPGIQFHQILVISRALSFTMAVGSAFLVFSISRHLKINFLTSFIAFVLTILIPIPWFSLARPDALVTFFGLATIGSMIFSLTENISKKKRSFYILSSAICSCFALLSKQSGIIFILIVFTTLVLKKKWREIIFALVIFLLTFLISSIVLKGYYSISNEASNFMYQNIFGGVLNGINYDLAYTKTYDLVSSRYNLFLIFPIASVILIYKSGLRNNDHLKFLALTYVICLVTGIIAALKDGSAIHYLNDSMIIGLILTIATIQAHFFSHGRLSSDLNFSIYCFYIAITIFSAAILVNMHRTYKDYVVMPSRADIDVILLNFLEKELISHPNVYFSVESGQRIATLRFPKQVIIPQPDVAYKTRNTPSVIAGKIQLIKNCRLRYVVKNNNEPLPDIFNGFKKLKQGINQEILVNECKK